tara:strand:+ start:83 stop:292 length:210 start_codon:yes stop_codon:yes gene_type:complete
MNTRINTTYRNGEKKWQVESEGCFGLWFPMGVDALFDTEEEAEAARLDPDNLIYKKQKQVVDENPQRFG